MLPLLLHFLIFPSLFKKLIIFSFESNNKNKEPKHLLRLFDLKLF